MNGRIKNYHHSIKRNPPGGTGADMADALTIERAIESAGYINARTKRDNADKRAARKMAEARAKVTLPSLESLKKLLED